MSDSAYYWVVIGRVLFDDEDTVFVTDLPVTQSEACDQFHTHMQEEDPKLYRAHGCLITAMLRSTEPIEHHD